MTKHSGTQKLLLLGKRGIFLVLASVLSLTSLLQLVQPQIASAAQLTPRSVTISTSQGAATNVEYLFGFTMPSDTPVQGVILEFCDTPLGTCNLPNGMDINGATADAETFTETDDPFAKISGATTNGDCILAGTSADTQVCLERTDTDPEAASTAKSLTLSGIVNPTPNGPAVFITVFVRITLYSDTAFATGVHNGTVAAAITQQLTTTGRVQERLEFCVAAINQASAEPMTCAGFPTTTNIDLGVIDNTTIVKAPVAITATNGSNNHYGAAMVNTNASSGVAVTYFPEEATLVSGGDTDQLRAFRVLPTDCSNAAPPVYTDQCFESAANTGENFVANTERFGLYIPCIMSQGTTTNNLAANVNASYSGTDADVTSVSPTNCETSEQATNIRYGFDDSGSPDNLLSSTSVVDNELIKLSFAAVASATTPTGTYAVVTTYIATPTF